jgi:hypothetical protein
MTMKALFEAVVERYLNVEKLEVDFDMMVAYTKEQVGANSDGSMVMSKRDDCLVFFGLDLKVVKKVSLGEASNEELKEAFLEVFGEGCVKV